MAPDGSLRVFFGGLGTALACFGLCGMVGLIVAFIRQNEPST